MFYEAVGRVRREIDRSDRGDPAADASASEPPQPARRSSQSKPAQHAQLLHQPQHRPTPSQPLQSARFRTASRSPPRTVSPAMHRRPRPEAGAPTAGRDIAPATATENSRRQPVAPADGVALGRGKGAVPDLKVRKQTKASGRSRRVVPGPSEHHESTKQHVGHAPPPQQQQGGGKRRSRPIEAEAH